MNGQPKPLNERITDYANTRKAQGKPYTSTAEKLGISARHLRRIRNQNAPVGAAVENKMKTGGKLTQLERHEFETAPKDRGAERAGRDLEELDRPGTMDLTGRRYNFDAAGIREASADVIETEPGREGGWSFDYFELETPGGVRAEIGRPETEFERENAETFSFEIDRPFRNARELEAAMFGIWREYYDRTDQ